MYDWLKSIGSCLSFKDPLSFSLGFSFFAQNGSEGLVYIYAVRQLASFRFRFTSKSQYFDYIKNFKNVGLDVFLESTFISQKGENPFWKSGFRPTQLVCSYIWIRK